MKFDKIKTKTKREEVYERLRRMIVSGEIKPGQSITLRSLAEGFGVSLMPVREAVYQLESENVIVIESNKSIHVNALSEKEMLEVLSMRLILEPLAAERSCERRPDSCLPKLEQYLKAMEESSHLPKKCMGYNSKFHLTLYSYADSPTLLYFIDYLWSRIGPYFHLFLEIEKNIDRFHRTHQEMFDAFASKNKEKLKDAVRTDLQNVPKLIIPYLKEHNQLR